MHPFLVFSDIDGNIYSHPYLRMVASSWGDFYLPEKRRTKTKININKYVYDAGTLSGWL